MDGVVVPQCGSVALGLFGLSPEMVHSRCHGDRCIDKSCDRATEATCSIARVGNVSPQ